MSERHRPLSLAGLRAFAAAARALSFTRAADELHLSQPALSRQIQALEEELGLPLFARAGGLRLTPAGESLRRAVEAGLRAIDECVRQLRGADSRRRIVVSTFASFASLWFIPRLARFGTLQPEVDVHCLATDRYVDLAAGEADVALRHGEPRRVGDDAVELFPDAVVPVCSPQLAAGDEPPLRAPADLARHTLLMLDEATETAFAQLSFEAWLQARGLPPITPRKVLRFTNHDQVIGAAIAGQGVALGRLPMIAELLAAGQLVMPIGAPMQRSSGYYLVPAPGAANRPEIASFMAWVREEACTTRALMTAVSGKAHRPAQPKNTRRAPARAQASARRTGDPGPNGTAR